MDTLGLEVNPACQVSGIGADQIPLLWPQLEGLVERGLMYARGTYTAGDIYDLLMRHYMQLWLIADIDGIRGIVITEMQHYPNKTLCGLVLVVGAGIKDWDYVIGPVEAWAFENGADAMIAYARPGWKSYAKKHGYDLAYHAYTKQLRVRNEDKH